MIKISLKEISLFIFLLTLSLGAHSAVDTSGVTFVYGPETVINKKLYGPLFWGKISISQGPSSTGVAPWAMLNLDTKNGLSISPMQLSSDHIGADIYSVNFGDEFSSTTIGAGSLVIPPLIIGETNSGYIIGPRISLPSSTFYLGISSGDISLRNIFGWAQFSYDANGWQLINSAVTYDQAGIIVGTLNTVAAVPETDTNLMLLVGVGMIGFMARRRKQTAA